MTSFHASWSSLGAPALRPLAQAERQYALIDGAQVDRLGQLLSTLCGGVRHRSVFLSPLAPDLANATPHLVEMEGQDAYRALLTPTFVGAVPFYGALSWLISPLAIDELAARLRHRLDVVLPDRFDCVNRFFDARIAPALSECLTTPQRADFFSVSTQWWVVSHQHRWQSLPCRFSLPDPYTAPLLLDDAQQAHMIDVCYPYSVIEHFRQTDEELLDQIPEAEQYGLFRQALSIAASYGIDGGPSAILFCTLAITRGPTFHMEPEWHAALEQIKRREITLQQAVKARHD